MFDIHKKTDDYMSVVLTHECNKTCPFKFQVDGEITLGWNRKNSVDEQKQDGIIHA